MPRYLAVFSYGTTSWLMWIGLCSIHYNRDEIVGVFIRENVGSKIGRDICKEEREDTATQHQQRRWPDIKQPLETPSKHAQAKERAAHNTIV
jgi:hypothetical protein